MLESPDSVVNEMGGSNRTMSGCSMIGGALPIAYTKPKSLDMPSFPARILSVFAIMGLSLLAITISLDTVGDLTRPCRI